ncbi:MAG: galactose oxidase-like domain-containing protein [Terriglobales bacterium]
MRHLVARAARLAGMLLLGLFVTTHLSAQADKFGQWTTLSTSMPINPVHVAMLHTGKVLIVSGSGNVAGNTNYQAGIFDPATGLVTTQPISWDMFCNGMVILPDGRPLISGGTMQYDPFHGETRAAVYDPASNSFTNVQSMAVGRWYPTATVLGDGRVMAFSGLDVNGGTTPAVQFFTAGTGWGSAVNAPWTPPLYPRMNLLPNGKVFYSGPGANSALFDPATQTWTQNVAHTNYGGSRGYGTTVLLPLTPANNYAPTVMIMGGANPSTSTTETIDLSQPTPAWIYGPSMSQPRIEMNAVILPSGNVLALGGSLNDEQNSSASLNADLYDPIGNTFSSAGANGFPRLYHSVALLLPDATVWVAGGNPQRGTYQHEIEIYQPAYLFTNDGQGHVIPATRPTISNAPGTVAYGSAFAVSTPDASNISSIALIRAGAVTHAFDMDQRMVGLSLTDQGNGTLMVNAPANGNLAPPGYYLLFLVNSAGVPSVANWVQMQTSDFSLSVTPASQQVPQGGSTSFTVTVTPQGGFTGTVNLGVSGLPAGVSTSFSVPVLTSGDSTLNVTVGDSVAPGTYPFTINGVSGAVSHSVNASLAVQAAGNYTVTVTPASRKVFQGGNTTWTVTVTPQNGFTDPVTLGVSGLPAGVTAAFSVPVLTSGNSTLNVGVGASTAPGTYPFTITGVSGAFTHSANATLTVLVQGTFTVTITPASQTVTRNSSSTYTVTITPLKGFNWTVDLTVKGTGTHITASLDPTAVGPTGTSTLTVNVDGSAARGLHTLRVIGTSGQLSKVGKLALTVQ